MLLTDYLNFFYFLRLLVGPIITAVTLVVLINIKASMGLLCFECANVPSARDCDTVKECGPHEVCFSTNIVSASGHIYRKMGCRNRMQCTSGIFGKRSLVRGVGDLTVCDSCCDSLWCQTNLCHDTGYDQIRGPICYNCVDQLPEEKCTHITECSRDEVCFESYKKSPSGHALRDSGCFGKVVCDRINAASHVNTNNETCWNCCHSDVCNTQCDFQKVHSSQASVVVVPSTQATCVDSTPVATCKLAAAVVCIDIQHAKNAGCMHHCGFC